MDAIVKFENVKKIYSHQIEALKGISFEVPQGSVFAILGPNGAGKTTTLKIMMGLIKQSSGHVQTLGINPFPDGSKNASFVPEEKNLYEWMKVSKMKAYFSSFAPNFSQQKFEDISKRLDLTFKRKVKTLSQGNRTKLYLSLALSQDVKLYILDEPTWGLDPVIRSEVLETVKSMVKEGKTIVYSSHILSEVEEVCDYLIILKEGEILYNGNIEDLKGTNGSSLSNAFLDLVKKGDLK